MNFGGSLIGPKISNEQITIYYDWESLLSFAIAARVYKVKNTSVKMLLDEWAAMLAPANTSGVAQGPQVPESWLNSYLAILMSQCNHQAEGVLPFCNHFLVVKYAW